MLADRRSALKRLSIIHGLGPVDALVSLLPRFTNAIEASAHARSVTPILPHGLAYEVDADHRWLQHFGEVVRRDL